MSNKITFKRERAKIGLIRVGHPNSDVQVKHNGKIIGTIHAPYWATRDNKWGASLMVNCVPAFKWIRIRVRWDSEQEARDWINAHAAAILKLDLHHMDPD